MCSCLRHIPYVVRAVWVDGVVRTLYGKGSAEQSINATYLTGFVRCKSFRDFGAWPWRPELYRWYKQHHI